MHRINLAAALLVAAFLLAAPSALASTAGVVVSQVYAGGGNAGATYQNDFVELFNRGSSPVDLSGWTVQYASATSTSWSATPLSGSIQPRPPLSRPAGVDRDGRRSAPGARRHGHVEPRRIRRQGCRRPRHGRACLRSDPGQLLERWAGRGSRRLRVGLRLRGLCARARAQQHDCRSAAGRRLHGYRR